MFCNSDYEQILSNRKLFIINAWRRRVESTSSSLVHRHGCGDRLFFYFLNLAIMYKFKHVIKGALTNPSELTYSDFPRLVLNGIEILMSTEENVCEYFISIPQFAKY